MTFEIETFKPREITFIKGNPPLNRSYRTNWAFSLLPLKERKGEWALLKELPHSGNAYATKALIQKHLWKKKEDGFELVVRNFDIGKYGVYGRYVGVENG